MTILYKVLLNVIGGKALYRLSFFQSNEHFIIVCLIYVQVYHHNGKTTQEHIDVDNKKVPGYQSRYMATSRNTQSKNGVGVHRQFEQI